MPLDSPGPVTDSVRLVADALAGREQGRAFRKLVGVHVPLEHPVAEGIVAEERVVVGRGRRPDRLVSDFLSGALTTSRPSDQGEQLGAEADAQVWDAAVDRVEGELARLLDERMLVGLVHVVGAAEHDDASRAVERRARVAVDRLPNGDRGVDGPERRRRYAERLLGIAPHQQDRVHGHRV